MASAENNAIVKNFAQELERMKPQIQLALPKHLNADRMSRIALTEFRKNPKLGDCAPKSVFAAIIMASQLGLEPGVMGQCYLIPYKGECTFVPGWQGFVDLVSRTGRASIWTGAVFEGDDFEYQFGDRPFIHHKPGLEEDPKKLRYVYAVGRVNGSDWPVMDVWPIAKVWKHRDRFNKVGERHYSFAHPEMYARKVVLLQVLKYMPKSVELTVAANLEHAAQEGRQGITIEAAVGKEYEAPDASGPQEGEEERQARESCEELLQKQGLNQAQIETKISQNRGKYDQLLKTLQTNTRGGNNAGPVAVSRGNSARHSVVEVDARGSNPSTAEVAPQEPGDSNAETEGSGLPEDPTTITRDDVKSAVPAKSSKRQNSDEFTI